MSGIQFERTREWRPEARLGSELNGKWTLVRVLGVGGASAVYEAVHRNGRRAAVKIMFKDKIREMPTCQLAAHEGWVANRISHPGVVEILDDDIAEDGSAYLVMELLEGETLDARRRRSGGRLALRHALPLFEQLLDVLAAAHDSGVVHRDIKPENVFVTSSGRIKVLDFGLAAAREAEREDAPWFGTPGFMPPEQARAEWQEVDALSDLWAAGATLYTVLTGRLVHPGGTPAGLVRAAAEGEADLSPLEAVAPTRIVDVLERSLATDKRDRFPNARAMLHALRAAAKPRWNPPRPVLAAKAPPVPRCHSTTRVFLLREGVARGGCTAGRKNACRLTCVMCPVCPESLTTLDRAVGDGT
jgi:serine/threonine protein kinase